MAVYMIVEGKEVFDPETYGEYLRQVPAQVARYGGKYLVRGGEITRVAGGWEPKKLVVIEFESMERFRAWYDSPEYRAIANLREKSARMDAVVVQGC